MFEIELFLTFKLHTKFFCMLNWIVWNGSALCIKMELTLITYYGWCAIKPNQTKPNQTYHLWFGTRPRNSLFRPTWFLLIIKILATRSKFLKPSTYSTRIHETFIFCIIHIFSRFCGVTVQIELVKHKLSN